MAQTVKHLEMIQGVINRMAANSFDLKRWSVLLAAAFIAISWRPEARSHVALLAPLSVLIFWCLDSHYLRQERMYRKLYDRVRVREHTDYSMDTREFTQGTTIGSAFFSVTLGIFYMGLMGTMVAVIILLDFFSKGAN